MCRRRGQLVDAVDSSARRRAAKNDHRRGARNGKNNLGVAKDRLVLGPCEEFVFIRLRAAVYGPMRQLGVIAVPSSNPKLTHGAELVTNHPVAALINRGGCASYVSARGSEAESRNSPNGPRNTPGRHRQQDRQSVTFSVPPK